MNVLVLGSGGREHALAQRLAQSRSLRQLWLAPGNGLTADQFECVAVDVNDPVAVVALVRRLAVDFVVVGAESPLLAGVSDVLHAAGVAVLGPSQKAALLEGSKAFAKQAMVEAGIMTAAFASFTTAAAAERWLSERPGAHVVKADGLMAGKGVLLCDDALQAVTAVRELFALGQQRVVIERRLNGPEASLIALCDGSDYRLFPLARDYKRIGIGDTGKNTGGMGAFCPVRLGTSEYPQGEAASPAVLGEIAIRPILRFMAQRRTPFRGFLYAGLLFHDGEVNVVEYNVRLGDPEAQVLLNATDGDLLPALYAAAVGQLSEVDFPKPFGAAVTVVLAAAGYPDAPVLGARIHGIEAARALPHVEVYGAGISGGGEYRVAGGRVLSIVGRGPDRETARRRANAAADLVAFAGCQRRTDIASGSGA